MSAKAIREATGKDLINRHLTSGTSTVKCKFASVNPDTNLADLVDANPWLKTEKLVAKPDQLIKRRGKLGEVFFYLKEKELIQLPPDYKLDETFRDLKKLLP